MELCSNEHEEVAYEGRDCPMCSMRDEKDDEIKEKEKQIERLEESNDELTDKVHTLQEEIDEQIQYIKKKSW